MSVPFSNNHLRVPRGFGTLMEGLAREILRDQPEDIPKYAAQYFEGLLKQRDDSGMDPAEWAAKLEDRFYNNHAFKTTLASPEKEPEKEETISKEKPYESQTEDESSHLAETSNLSTTQPNVSEEVNLSESAEEYEEKQDVTEENYISQEEGLSEEESINVLPAGYEQPDDVSGTEEEEDPTITTFDQVDVAANGKDSSSASEQNIPPSNLEPTDLLSFREISNVDVCAQELVGVEEDTGGKQDTAIIDELIVDSEGEGQTDSETFTYSGPADKDVCASEFIGAEETMVKATAEDDDDSSEPQPEDVVVQSSVSLSETPESNLHEAEEQVVKTNEEDTTEAGASSRGLHESLADMEGGLDSNAVPEDSLVEISFEDVPEAQQIKEVEEKRPEEEDSVELLKTRILEMQQEEEESKEVAEVARDQIISSTQEHDEPVMVGFEKEVHSEEGELTSQHQISQIMKEEMETKYSNLNDSGGDEDEDDDEKCEGVSSSHQLTIQADMENPEVETDPKNDDNEKIEEDQNDEEETKSDDLDFKEEDEITDTVRGDIEDIHTESHSEVEEQEIDGGSEKHSSQVIQSDQSTAAMDSETLEAQHLAEQSESRTPVESQLEDTAVEKEITSKEETSESEELVEGGTIDCETQEKSEAVCEEGSVSPTQSTDQTPEDHQGPPLGPETDSTEPEGKSSDKEECSRPQEEEDIMDIPLDDPEANRAAAKIQAGFRGHMTRKKMKPEDKAEGEEVSSTGDVLNGSQGDTETGGSGAVEGDDTSVPEQ